MGAKGDPRAAGHPLLAKDHVGGRDEERATEFPFPCIDGGSRFFDCVCDRRRGPRASEARGIPGLAIEPSPLAGFDHLVRFRGPAGNIIVTVRVSEVEQVFCSQAGAIGCADLTLPAPVFVPVRRQVFRT